MSVFMLLVLIVTIPLAASVVKECIDDHTQGLIIPFVFLSALGGIAVALFVWSIFWLLDIDLMEIAISPKYAFITLRGVAVFGAIIYHRTLAETPKERLAAWGVALFSEIAVVYGAFWLMYKGVYYAYKDLEAVFTGIKDMFKSLFRDIKAVLREGDR